MPLRLGPLCLSLIVALSTGCTLQTPTQPGDAGAVAPLLTSASRPGTTPPPFVFPDGCCYYDGAIVRTVVPPAANPRTGRDNFYGIVNGVSGQKAVVAVAPGDANYHGGHWKFHAVTFIVPPYLLTSEAAVLAAASAGHVTIARNAAADFKCPIQP